MPCFYISEYVAGSSHFPHDTLQEAAGSGHRLAVALLSPGSNGSERRWWITRCDWRPRNRFGFLVLEKKQVCSFLNPKKQKIHVTKWTGVFLTPTRLDVWMFAHLIAHKPLAHSSTVISKQTALVGFETNKRHTFVSKSWDADVSQVWTNLVDSLSVPVPSEKNWALTNRQEGPVDLLRMLQPGEGKSTAQRQTWYFQVSLVVFYQNQVQQVWEFHVSLEIITAKEPCSLQSKC